ncbi:MAG: ArsC family reductase [Alphaproteobacteria bacterium]|nr:MAG: ArsC family reductase [Alphaproteobacteria bacterium]
MITLYGIANCDTIRRARKWLEDRGVAYRFHDYRKDGIDEAMIRRWVGELGWEALLNRRGTTWRKLPEAVRERVDEATAIALMAQHPALIKRPVFDLGTEHRVGFAAKDEAALAERLGVV